MEATKKEAAYCPFTTTVDIDDKENYQSADCGNWCKLYEDGQCIFQKILTALEE
jgi:hypothetical protein